MGESDTEVLATPDGAMGDGFYGPTEFSIHQ